MRNKISAALQAMHLMFHVWRLIRKTGLPFQPLLEAHLEMMDMQADMIVQLVHEQMVAEIARNN